jgi:hypothetical protein
MQTSRLWLFLHTHPTPMAYTVSSSLQCRTAISTPTICGTAALRASKNTYTVHTYIHTHIDTYIQRARNQRLAATVNRYNSWRPAQSALGSEESPNALGAVGTYLGRENDAGGRWPKLAQGCLGD